jgi:hypothetical protein
MTARIGYLAALAGDGGRLPGDAGSAAYGRPAALRPPRRVFNAVGLSDAEPGFLDVPDFTDGSGLAGPPGLPDEMPAPSDEATARSAANETPARPASADDAAPGPAGRLEHAPGPVQGPNRVAPGSAADRAASRPGRRSAASAAPASRPVPEPWPGEPAGPPVPLSADTSARGPEHPDGDADERHTRRTAADGEARPASAGASDARSAVPGHPPESHSLPSSPAGQQPALDHAGAEHGRVSQGPVRRAAGEPWRFPRLRQPPPARDGAAAPAVPARAVTAAPSAPPPVAAPVTGTQSVTGIDPAAASPVTPAGPVPPDHPARRPAGDATGISAGQLASVPLSDVPLAAPPQVTGTRHPRATESPPLRPPSARGPRTSLASTANPGPPLEDALLPGTRADASATASALSAAALSAAALSAAALSVTAPSGPLRTAPPSAPPPLAVQPSTASLTTAPPPTAPPARPAEPSPRRGPSADRAEAQLTPSANSASRASGSSAEASTPPSAPALSIGTIEVTLVPPSPAPAPVRPARREPPKRLSRGLGRRFGQGQA